MSERARDLIRRWKSLQNRRTTWESHWDDCARVMLPASQGFVTSITEGERLTDDVYDGTPMQAARGLANAIGGLLRPPGQRFFFIKPVDDAADQSDQARQWLAEVERRMMAAFENPKARFRQATGEADQGLAVLGTAIVYVGEAASLGRLIFQTVALKDGLAFFDDEGNARGVFRCMRLAVRQAMEKFGRSALGNRAHDLLRNDRLDDRLEYLHAVVPRAEGRGGGVLAANMAYASVWIEVDSEHEVSSGGFHEFPFAVPRWDTSSGEDYGRSPGMIALPDANTLQGMGETILVAGQRAADPPLMAPDDGAFSIANTFPGGISYYEIETAKIVGRIPVVPLESGTNLPISRDMQQDMRNQVFAAFFRNVLNLPVDGPEMTATEVIQRKEEFIREIGPVFGRLESDYTAPMVERAFAVMLRGGAFPPPPPDLAGRRIRFEYESPVKRIRQQIEAAALRIWVQEAVVLAQARPDVLDNIDLDAYIRFQAEALGAPHRILNPREKVEAARRARAQAMQTQAAMAAMETGAGALGKAAPAMKMLTDGRAAA